MTDRYVRWPEVKARCGLSRSTVDKRIALGTFPPKHALGGNCMAWLESELSAWMAAPATWRAAGASPDEGAGHGD